MTSFSREATIDQLRGSGKATRLENGNNYKKRKRQQSLRSTGGKGLPVDVPCDGLDEIWELAEACLGHLQQASVKLLCTLDSNSNIAERGEANNLPQYGRKYDDVWEEESFILDAEDTGWISCGQLKPLQSWHDLVGLSDELIPYKHVASKAIERTNDVEKRSRKKSSSTTPKHSCSDCELELLSSVLHPAACSRTKTHWQLHGTEHADIAHPASAQMSPKAMRAMMHTLLQRPEEKQSRIVSDDDDEVQEEYLRITTTLHKLDALNSQRLKRLTELAEKQVMIAEIYAEEESLDKSTELIYNSLFPNAESEAPRFIKLRANIDSIAVHAAELSVGYSGRGAKEMITKAVKWASSLHEGDIVDAVTPDGIWRPAVVVGCRGDVNGGLCFLKVHFLGTPQNWDSWISVAGIRLLPPAATLCKARFQQNLARIDTVLR